MQHRRSTLGEITNTKNFANQIAKEFNEINRKFNEMNPPVAVIKVANNKGVIQDSHNDKPKKDLLLSPQDPEAHQDKENQHEDSEDSQEECDKENTFSEVVQEVKEVNVDQEQWLEVDLEVNVDQQQSLEVDLENTTTTTTATTTKQVITRTESMSSSSTSLTKGTSFPFKPLQGN